MIDPSLPADAENISAGGFNKYVGPLYRLADGADGSRRYAFAVAEKHMNAAGTLHGGMLMTFADLALGQAVWDATDRVPSVTINMQTQFLKPARVGDMVEVLPELIRKTRSLIFMRGDFKVNGKTIFSASSIWKLLGQD